MNIMEAARYFVFLSYHMKKMSLTPLKLQKLLYLAQGWSYVWDNKSLFEDEFEAWQYGPVNVAVYNYFKVYGRGEIPEEEGDGCIWCDDISRETIEVVWNNYARCSAFDLVELTHSQDPWINAYSMGRTIKNIEIKRYFQSTY